MLAQEWKVDEQTAPPWQLDPRWELGDHVSLSTAAPQGLNIKITEHESKMWSVANTHS